MINIKAVALAYWGGKRKKKKGNHC